jgi:hypothetical protein
MSLKIKSFSAIVAQLAIVLLSASIAHAKPLNYLIILGDDISASTLGCYGALNPHTSPQIDKLAAEGVRFTNMFVSEAMCAPTRAELYTGLQPERNGCNRNHLPTNKGTKSVVHHLKTLGYRTGSLMSRWARRMHGPTICSNSQHFALHLTNNIHIGNSRYDT